MQEQEQIIYHGYTRSSDWDALEQRSIKTRQRIEPLCPACNAEIHHTQTTGLRCVSCQAPVEIYQHRHHTKKADTRLIYIQAKGQRRAVLSLDMQCLSCQQRLTEAETCTNTCGIQTYLVSEHDDGELYIRRDARRSDADVPRELTEIQTRQTRPTDATQTDTDTRAKQTQNTENLTFNQPENQPHPRDDFTDDHPNPHKDVKGQVLAHLREHHIATTQKLIEVCKCSREALNQALHKLIDARRIRKVKRGVYELINHN